MTYFITKRIWITRTTFYVCDIKRIVMPRSHIHTQTYLKKFESTPIL